MPRYLRTDETHEAVLILETTAEFADRVADDLYQWRWVVVALHTALQGFMVLALRGSEGLYPLRPDVMQQWLQAHETGGEYPEERLDTYLGLYKKIKRDACMRRTLGSEPFRPEGSQGRSVKTLNALRNDFAHFLPHSWSLEVSGLPTICLDCLAVVEFLGWRSNTITRFGKGALRQRARDTLDSGKLQLELVQREYTEESRGRPSHRWGGSTSNTVAVIREVAPSATGAVAVIEAGEIERTVTNRP